MFFFLVNIMLRMLFFKWHTHTYILFAAGCVAGHQIEHTTDKPKRTKDQERGKPTTVQRVAAFHVHAHPRMTSSLDSSWSECSPWFAIKGRWHIVVICRKNILVYRRKTRVAMPRGGSRTYLFSTWCCRFGLSLRKRCVTLPPLRGRDQPPPPHLVRPKKVRRNSGRFNGRHVVVETCQCNNARNFLTVGWDITDTLGGPITFKGQNTWHVVPIIWRPNWLSSRLGTRRMDRCIIANNKNVQNNFLSKKMYKIIV